jgi:hypothetical protein
MMADFTQTKYLSQGFDGLQRHANANLSMPFELVTIFEGKQDFQNIHHRIAHNFTFTFQQRRQNNEKLSLIPS